MVSASAGNEHEDVFKFTKISFGKYVLSKLEYTFLLG
jgi:hypothetical protein